MLLFVTLALAGEPPTDMPGSPALPPELGIGTLEVPHPLTIEGDGRVRDRDGRSLSVSELALQLGDVDLAHAYRDTRSGDLGTWVPTMVAGGALLGGGGLYTLYTALYGYYGTQGSDLVAGVTVTALGGIGLATGIVGTVRSGRIHGDIYHWYNPAALERKVREYNDGPAPGPTGFYVTPVIGPGTVGLAGTF